MTAGLIVFKKNSDFVMISKDYTKIAGVVIVVLAFLAILCASFEALADLVPALEKKPTSRPSMIIPILLAVGLGSLLFSAGLVISTAIATISPT